MKFTHCMLLIFGIASLPFFLGGCQQSQQSGRPIAGTPDGDVEYLSVSSTGAIEHKEGKFLELVDRKDQKLVLVDFWATWCGPCRKLAPHLEAIKEKWGDKIEVVKVDVDQAGDISEHMGISSIPDVRIFRNGTQVGSFVGLMPRAEIEALLKSLQ